MKRIDRLTLLDNILRDKRRKHPDKAVTRREFVQTSAGLFIFAAAPIRVSSGCDTATIAAVLQVAFLIAEVARLVGELIKGDMRVDNPNTVCRTYDIAVRLAEVASGQTVMEPLEEKDICKGENNFSLDDWALMAKQAGEHQMSTVLDGQTFSSPSFGVTS